MGVQSGMTIAPLLSRVVEQGLAAAQGGEGIAPADAEARLSEDLQRVDAFGVEGANPVNEQEVPFPACKHSMLWEGIHVQPV